MNLYELASLGETEGAAAAGDTPYAWLAQWSAPAQLDAALPLPQGVVPSTAGAGRGTADDPRSLAYRQEPAPKKSFVGQVQESVVGGAKSLASMHPALAPLVRAFAPDEAPGNAAPNRNEFAPVDEARRGLQTGATGLRACSKSFCGFKKTLNQWDGRPTRNGIAVPKWKR